MTQSVAKSDPVADAITLLKGDHRKVEALFEEFEKSGDSRAKERIGGEICKELTIHARIEEKIFYPRSMEEVPEAEDQVKEGFVEHEGIKRLVRDLEKLSAKDEYFETRMKVLKEYVKHHVKEEETSMFPKIQKGDIDLDALGEALAKAKQRAEAGLEKKPKPARRASGRRSRHSESRAST